MTEEKSGISRRTVMKGAAWSVPVVAAAIAVPAQAASLPPGTDLLITGECVGDYDLSVLEAITGAALLGTVQGLLKTTLGLDPGAARRFTISAVEGTIPQTASFRLTFPPALINVTGLSSILGAAALGVVSTTANTVDFTLTEPLTQGSAISFDVFDALIDVGLASSVTLESLDTDNPSGSDSADSATITTLLGLAVTVPLVGGSLAIQVCS